MSGDTNTSYTAAVARLVVACLLVSIDTEDLRYDKIIPFPNKGEQNSSVPIQSEICPLLFRLTAFVLLQPTLYVCSPF
jgi:hypothetical protein